MILRKFLNLKNVDFKETGAGVKGIINWNTILDIIFFAINYHLVKKIKIF